MERTLKILLIEDNPTDAELIKQQLRDNPARIFKLVMTEEEFIDALDNFLPDLIISDNTLPQFSAEAALEIFNSRKLNIPFILVTGTVSEEFAAGIIKLGADDYILKDRLKRLPAAIDAALKKKRAEASIKQAEETRKLIMRSSLDAIVCVDIKGEINAWNPQAEQMFGWKEAEITGQQFFETVIPSHYLAAKAASFMESLKQSPHIAVGRINELTAIDRTGREFPIELAIVHIQENAADFYCAFIRDITERRRAEQKMRFDASLLEAVGQAVIATDPTGKVIYWNSAAERTYGWSQEEAIGKNVIDLTPTQQNRKEAMAIMEELIKGNSWNGEFNVQGKSGHPFPIFTTNSPLYDTEGKLIAIIGVSIDISERKRAERRLHVMEQRMLSQKLQEQRKVSRAIIKAQEEEKNHIGKELHDNISQILATTKMFLTSAAKRDVSVKDILQYPLELINNSIEEIRLLSHKQVTPLKNIDLEALIRRLFSNFNRETMPQLHFEYGVQSVSLSDDLKLNIYRLVQEQLNNIFKHANAKNVYISITMPAGNIIISVTDDGKGFEVSKKKGGIGFSNMANRIEAFNGKMSIKSKPGKGCTITVTIPC